MKIVINALSARIGGGQTYLRNLLARLPDDEDLELLVFAQGDVPLGEDPRLKRGYTRSSLANPFSRLWWEYTSLPAILREFDADILFCPGGLVNTRAPEGCKTVTMFRNMMPFDPEAYGRLPWGGQRIRNMLLRPAMLKSMGKADMTIFISNFARRKIEDLITLKHAVTIPHGVSDKFRTHDQSLPRPESLGEGGYIFYVSRFEVYKNHMEVVQAYQRLPEAVRQQYRLVLAGEYSLPGGYVYPEGQRVLDYIEQDGLADRVLMLGGVPYDDLPALYRNADLVLFASTCENCPNILLESLGSGRPTLSSDIEPMPEFGGLDLMYFSPYDPAELSQKMERILSDEQLAASIGEAAHTQSRLYDWDVTARRTWTALYELVSDNA